MYSSKANNKSFHKRACIYCDSDEHKSVDYKTVTTLNDRRSILKEKRVCFNCTGFGHRVADCRSIATQNTTRLFVIRNLVVFY